MSGPRPGSARLTPDRLAALFEGPPPDLAAALLGCRLTVQTVDGAVTVRLTETEAYGDAGVDPGAHSFRGPTPRNAALFGPPRRTYVYLNYGIHRCLNLVGHPAGQAGGVLLRSAEAVDGRELAVARRGRDTGVRLLSGPGNLGQGLGITLGMGHAAVEIAAEPPSPEALPPLPGAPVRDADDDGAPGSGAPAAVTRGGTVPPGLTSPDAAPLEPVRFVLAPPPEDERRPEVRRGPRVGVSGEGGSARFPWRCVIVGDRSVSAYRRGRNVPEG